MRRKKVSMDKLFGYKEEAVVTRESWGVDLQPLAPVANESKKRQKTASTVPKKKAKIERGAEDITDETTKQLATELLDQIETTPCRIILNFSSTKSSEVCPLPPSFNQNVKSNWSIDNLKERQLSGLLDQNCKSFKPLGIKKIQKVKTEEETLPRQLDLKQTIAKLKNEDKKDDEYVGFSVAIANVLRRCEPKIAEKLAQSIVALLETDASSVVHKM